MTIMIAVTGSQVGMGLWPSLDTASSIADKANVALIGSLVVGVISTVLIVWMGNVKESHWEIDRTASAERIAQLNNETARLRAKEPLVDEALMANAGAGRANALATQQNMVTSEILAFSQNFATRESLSEAARAMLITPKVASFKGTKFSAIVSATDIKLEVFVTSLRSTLRLAGWQEVEPVGAIDRSHPTIADLGIVRISIGATDNVELSLAAKGLVSALIEQGIAAEEIPNSDNDTTAANVIRIVVSPKP